MTLVEAAPFVARTDELARLARAVAAAAQGEPSVLLVGGDAGVGKTRLLGRAAELAQESGATVVVSHCVDLGGAGLPYLPFAEALVQLRARCPVVDDVAAQRPALARLLDADPAVSATDTADTAVGVRMQLFDGIAGVLAAVGDASSPLVLVVEDLHWADRSTLDVLRFLVARLRDEHLVVVATYRTDDLHRRHPLRPVLAELTRHPSVERLDLAPFTADELREFTTAVAGSALDDGAFANVRRRSEGNAYYAQELVESGVGAGELPWSLADVLHARVERLDAAAQRLVRLASADGRQVSEALLRAVAARPVLGGPTGGDVDTVLREAVAQQVLVPEKDRIAFRHALLAEAVYADLLPGEQAAVHRAYLDVLHADPTLGTPAQRAVHAHRAHDLPATLVAHREAARAAARIVAPQEELRHLEQVLGLWDAVPDAGGLLEESRADVALAAAAAAARAGEPARATALARAVVEARTDPLDRARLQHVLAHYLLADDDLDEMLERTTDALAVLPVEPPSRDRAWTLAMRARAALNLDLDDVARTDALRAVAEAQAVGAPDVEADALTTLAVLEVAEPEVSADLLLEARDRARAAGDIETELRCWSNLVANRYYAGLLDDATTLGLGALDYARATGMSWSVYGMNVRLFVALARYLGGDLTAVDHGPVPGGWATGFAALDLYAATARGDADAVERGLALRDEWDVDGQIALVAGGCTVDALTWRGADDAAVELAEEVVRFLGREWSDAFLGRIWLSALALAALADRAERDALVGQDVSALVARGDAFLEAAARTAERGRPRGGTLGPEGRAWLARAHAEHGRLAAAGGLPGADDPAAWERAVDAFSFGYRYEVARSRWRWAQALVGAGDRRRAQAQLALAVAEADAMGALPLADAARALARRARLDAGGVRHAAADVLTDREREVLLLVAQGLSNRQVGERLYISGKTVSVHVSNVLAKLGAATRTQAVSLAHERGLLG